MASRRGSRTSSRARPAAAVASWGTDKSAPVTPQAQRDDVGYLAHAFEAQPPITLANWDLTSIRGARDAHALGVFSTSALLADALLTDGRINAALMQRIGPMLGIPWQIVAGSRWRGKGLGETARTEAEALFAEGSPALSSGTRAAAHVSTAMMGFAILQNVALPREDGSRIDVEVRPWPASQSQWNEGLLRYQVFTTEGVVTIEPGDGKWIVLEPHGPRSFRYGRIRPLALLWADRAYAMRDRSNHSASHGSMNIIGTLPEGVKVQSEEGKAFATKLRMLQQARSGLVKAFGSSVDAFEPKTLAWQIFGQIVSSANGDIDLILKGINSEGVYKPISQIDGVRYDLVKTELAAARLGWNTGLLRPWARWNFGDDPDLAPAFEYLIPDPREQERLDALGRRYKSFTDTLDGYRAAGLEVDDALVTTLAKRFGVEPAKLGKAPAPPAPAGPPGGVPPAPPPTEAADEQQIQRNASDAA